MLTQFILIWYSDLADRGSVFKKRTHKKPLTAMFTLWVVPWNFLLHSSAQLSGYLLKPWRKMCFEVRTQWNCALLVFASLKSSGFLIFAALGTCPTKLTAFGFCFVFFLTRKISPTAWKRIRFLPECFYSGNWKMPQDTGKNAFSKLDFWISPKQKRATMETTNKRRNAVQVDPA